MQSSKVNKIKGEDPGEFDLNALGNAGIGDLI